MEELKDMYWDINKTLSRQRLFNFVLGPRGAGKTYGFKKRAIRRFLQKGKQFVYVRRYETELPAAEMRNYFDDVGPKEFPDHEFKAYNGLFRIDNKIAGWYVPLSKAHMLKSVPFPDVEIICFDEFIIDTGATRYLPNEVRAFLELYSTISRDRDIPAFFLSNAISVANPYFVYFDIKFEPDQRVKLFDDISVELVENQKYIEHAKSTRFGKLVSGTDYGAYAVENKFLLDTDTFIEQLPESTYYVFTLVCNGKEFGVFRSPYTYLMYISDKVDPTNKTKISLTVSEHNMGTILAQRSSIFITEIIQSFCRGELRFSTANVKNHLYDTLRRLI